MELPKYIHLLRKFIKLTNLFFSGIIKDKSMNQYSNVITERQRTEVEQGGPSTCSLGYLPPAEDGASRHRRNPLWSLKWGEPPSPRAGQKQFGILLIHVNSELVLFSGCASRNHVTMVRYNLGSKRGQRKTPWKSFEISQGHLAVWCFYSCSPTQFFLLNIIVYNSRKI